MADNSLLTNFVKIDRTNMRKQVFVMMMVSAVVMMIGCAEPEEKTFRLLHWNIQNGMWDGQNDNYDRFVEFVKSKDPDVCV